MSALSTLFHGELLAENAQLKADAETLRNRVAELEALTTDVYLLGART